MNGPTKVERPLDHLPPPVTETSSREGTSPEISSETMRKLLESEDASLKSAESGLEGMFVDIDLPPQAMEALKANAEQANTVVNQAHAEANTVLRQVTEVPAAANTLLKAVPEAPSDLDTAVQPIGKEKGSSEGTKRDRPPVAGSKTEQEPSLPETPKDAKEMAESALENAVSIEEKLSSLVRGAYQENIDRALKSGDVEATAFWTERLALEGLRRQAEAALRGNIALEIDLSAKLGKKLGVTQPRVMSMEGGEEAVYKPQANENAPDVVKNAMDLRFRPGERSLFAREWLNGQIDRSLGLDVVPPTVIRTNGGGVGSVQGWVEGNMLDEAKDWRQRALPDSVENVAALHYLTGNFDGRDPNLMIGADGRLKAIDNGYTFLPRAYLSDGKYQVDPDLYMQSKALDQVTRAATTEVLKDPKALKQDMKKYGIIYVENPENGPYTPVSEGLRKRLDLMLGDDEAGKAIRESLKSGFDLALGADADDFFAEYLKRANILRDKGFAPHSYPEYQEAINEQFRANTMAEKPRGESGAETERDTDAAPNP